MIIIPAIDLQAGRCVRLQQGQFDKVTVFDTPPLERAAYFAKSGAKCLHVVDLDGAQTGAMQQWSLISAMQNTGIAIQAGGGIRTLEQAKMCRNAGIAKLVIGSIAISNPELTVQIIQDINPEHIILALDVRMTDDIPMTAINGWQTSSNSSLWEVISYYQQFGIRQILCTDIACDGMMQGPNFNLYQEAVERFPKISWQASGGIRSQEDIAQLKTLGITGAILGLTLYQDTFNLAQCLTEYELC